MARTVAPRRAIRSPRPSPARYLHAGTALDAAWALFEMRMLADPDRRPNDAWTEITSRHLGIAPHPEWSWWAIRGQLVQEPGTCRTTPSGTC